MILTFNSKLRSYIPGSYQAILFAALIIIDIDIVVHISTPFLRPTKTKPSELSQITQLFIDGISIALCELISKMLI